MRRLSFIPAFVGEYALGFVGATGTLAMVFSRTLLQLPRLNRRELWRGVTLFGYRSLPLAFIVGTLAGATVVLQTGMYVQRFGARNYLGWAAGFSIIWEFGPLLLGLMMGARVGARNAAELASLNVGGQLEGLRGISLDPFALLVAPRVLATALSVAGLSTVTFLIAVLWEAAAALFTLGIPARVFFSSFEELLTAGDLAAGISKCLAFGITISLISTAAGLRAQGGAQAVGRAAAAAVVWSSGAIYALDFLLTPLLSAVFT
ncbi:MAG: MlaE family ABC transporter permease [Myxococcaceae bacterium]